MTSPVDHIRRFHAELTGIRRDLHAHPELSFQEQRTSGIVVDWGGPAATMRSPEITMTASGTSVDSPPAS